MATDTDIKAARLSISTMTPRKFSIEIPSLQVDKNKGANPHLSILVLVHFLGNSWVRHFILLLLQAVLHVLDKLCNPTSVMGHGIFHGKSSIEAYLLDIRLQMVLQSGPVEPEGACIDRCRILGLR